MTVFDDVQLKIKKKNKILFDRNSLCLQELRDLICGQKHLTIVLWAFDCLKIPIKTLSEKYPNELDIIDAYELSLMWAHGKVKMPIAKKAILACHAVAKKLTDSCDIALCHAVGQGCSAVHVETHALGLVFYELTAIVVECGYNNYEENVLDKINFYYQKLKWWEENILAYEQNEQWADFLIKDNTENKENLLSKNVK